MSLSFACGGRKEGQQMRGAIFINTLPDKDPSGSTEREGGAAFGINARPLIVRPITSIWSNLKREKRSNAASGPFCCPAIK